MSNYRNHQFNYLKSIVDKIDIENILKIKDSPILLLDKEGVIDRYRKMETLMPAVRPHFAIKSCPMPELLEIYKSIGAYLDVATSGEIELLNKIQYPASRLIHTHPHKTPKEMKVAYDYGIRYFTIDDLNELEILEPYKKDIKVFLRLSFSSHHNNIDLSYKFGLHPQKALSAIKIIINNGFNLCGLSFHVGSQVKNVKAYTNALNSTADIYDKVRSTMGYNFTMLDIGGGFPSPYNRQVLSLEDIAKAINDVIDHRFKDIQILSEPGRALINEFVILLASVISRTKRNGKHWLFINDGIYGSFSDLFSEKVFYNIFSLKEIQGSKITKNYIVAGPTCDSLDVLSRSAKLPELNPRDLLLVPDIGAYSYSLSTNFNSIDKATVHVI